MEIDVAKNVVRAVCNKQSKAAGLSTFNRFLMGVTASRIKHKRVLFSSDGLQTDPFSGWWMMINFKDTANTIIAKEAVKVALKHVAPVEKAVGAIGKTGSLGKAVERVHNLHGQLGQVDSVKSMLNGSKVHEIYNQLNGAWQAGTWSAAQGTGQEFAFAWDSFMAGGYLAMGEPKSDGQSSGQCYFTADKDQLMHRMAASERAQQKAGGQSMQSLVKNRNVGTINFSFKGDPFSMTLA